MKVRVIADWGWWFHLGEIYEVGKYVYRATNRGTVDYCFCAECEAERFGLTLYEMYVVISGEKSRSIIPVVACKEVESL